MGIVIDTNVFVLAERSGHEPDFVRWRLHGTAYISSITVSELLVGVFRANTPRRRRMREAYVERIVTGLPVLDFTARTARIHARMVASLPAGATVGAHDALIGAQAAEHGYAVLTSNVREFSRLPGLEVVAFGD